VRVGQHDVHHRVAADGGLAAAEPEAGPDPLTAALADINPDSLTPREALDALYELKRLAP